MTDLDRVAAYGFTLPDELIATQPAARRSDARMLDVTGERLADRAVRDLVSLLGPNDLLVVNDARVSPVRVRGQRGSGGAVEVFVLGFGAEGDWSDPRADAVVFTKSNKRLRSGERIEFAGGASGEVLPDDERGQRRFRFHGDAWSTLTAAGEMPLPPYITKRRTELGEAAVRDADAERYQTVFAATPGAVAAPTAGLHFDAALLDALCARGVRRAAVTLWVGAGTFAPVRVERLSDHSLHAEVTEVSQETADAIAETRRRGGRVVAVGTTVVRTLESRADDDGVRAGRERTALFVRPGFRFRVVDALLTNFHLPESTLLALVCAFGGYERVMAAYRHAVASGYRFYSYGDAMWLEREAAQ